MRRVINKSRSFKIKHHRARLIDLDDYLSVFPGAKATYKTCETELNENVLNIIPNR